MDIFSLLSYNCDSFHTTCPPPGLKNVCMSDNAGEQLKVGSKYETKDKIVY